MVADRLIDGGYIDLSSDDVMTLTQKAEEHLNAENSKRLVNWLSKESKFPREIIEKFSAV